MSAIPVISKLLTVRMLFPVDLDHFGPGLFLEAPKAAKRFTRSGLEGHSFVFDRHWFSFDFLHDDPHSGGITYRIVWDKLQA